MSSSGSSAVLLARLVDPGRGFTLPPQVIQYLRADSWQGLLTKALFAATYGAGLYMTYRAVRQYVQAKTAEVDENRKLKSHLWSILREWDGSGQFTPSEFETEEQDDDGVVMHTTRTGTTLFFRRSCEGIPGHDESCWEWSRNCQDWFPTFDLKKLEIQDGCNCVNGCFPSEADKTFILRMEVERRLRQGSGEGTTGRLSRAGSGFPHPPPLDPPESASASWEAPEEFLCPITLQLMSEPVISPSGITYNLPGIAKWISNHHTDPATGETLQTEWLIPNLTLRNLIQKWLVENSMIGDESIDMVEEEDADDDAAPPSAERIQAHAQRRISFLS